MQQTIKPHYALVLSGALSYCGNAITSLVTIATFSKLVSNTDAFAIFFVSLALPPLILRNIINSTLKRYQSQRIMVIAEMLRALLVLLLAILIQIEFISSSLVIVFLVIQGTLATFYSSAFYTSLPTLISRDAIEPYNSLSSSLTQLGYLCGASTFTLLVNRVSQFDFLLFDSFTFLFSAYVLYRLSMNSAENRIMDASQTKNKLALAETIPLLGGLSTFALACFTALPIVLLKVFNIISSTIALKHSTFGQQGYGFIDSMACFGVISTGIMIALTHGRFRVGNKGFLTLLLLTFGILIFAITNRSSILIAGGFGFSFGALYSLLVTIARSSIYLLGGGNSVIRDNITMINAMESAGGICFALIMPTIIHSVGLSQTLILALALPFLFLAIRGMFARQQQRQQHPD